MPPHHNTLTLLGIFILDTTAPHIRKRRIPAAASRHSPVISLVRLTALQMAERLRAGTTTSVELVQAHLDRIAAHQRKDDDMLTDARYGGDFGWGDANLR